MVATIDWTNVKTGLFVTLTWPDFRWPADAGRRMRALWQFFRLVEDFHDRKICALWRVEWKTRKTGANRGKLLPHFHLIIFGCRFIPKDLVKRYWARALRTKKKVVAWVDSLSSQKKHAVYIAKYAAKPPSFSVLDNVPYSRIDGRHWGYYRLKLLPRAVERLFEGVSEANVLLLRSLAAKYVPHYDEQCDAGFSLFGRMGAHLANAIAEILLDNPE